jgi:hypothetical protein
MVDNGRSKSRVPVEVIDSESVKHSGVHDPSQFPHGTDGKVLRPNGPPLPAINEVVKTYGDSMETRGECLVTDHPDSMSGTSYMSPSVATYPINYMKCFRYILEQLAIKMRFNELPIYQIKIVGQVLPNRLVAFTERLGRIRNGPIQQSMIGYFQRHSQ